MLHSSYARCPDNRSDLSELETLNIGIYRYQANPDTSKLLIGKPFDLHR
jgi:hypothetical protein